MALQATRLLNSITLAICLLASVGNNAWAQNPTPTAPGPPPPGAQPKPRKPYVFSFPGMHLADEIPINFPIASYNSNIVKRQFINTTKGSASAAACIVTKDQVPTVYGWYKDTCQRGGWTTKTPNPQAASKYSKTGQLYMIEARKDRQLVYIFCNPDKKSGGTSVNINWSKEKK